MPNVETANSASSGRKRRSIDELNHLTGAIQGKGTHPVCQKTHKPITVSIQYVPAIGIHQLLT
uniref:Uncharacterized protein n=1 Tax=Tolypothrix bouteillei VB521301 TaxID=1479485 RepID=A0A0C1QUH5_9CYAN